MSSSSKSVGFVQKFLMRIPSGITLKGEEAQKQIDLWKEEKKNVGTKQWDFEKLATKVQRRLDVLDPQIIDAAAEVRKAQALYKRSKTPLARRRWARRLVLANELHKYNRNSKQQLETMVERVKDAIEDSKLVTKLIDSRVADAEIYLQLNGRLRLVGKDLAAAKREHIMPEIEYQNAEYSMEQIENELLTKDDQTMLIEADAIALTDYSEQSVTTEDKSIRVTKSKR